MRFSANGYYIEKYIKCMNCGALIYGQGIEAERNGKKQIFCSDWCVQWSALRDSGAENIRLPLPKA
jgi:5-oxoprolinase (ATP-hydrolysing)/N-methylhydantoinase B